MHAFLRFNRALLKLPIGGQLWLGLLIGANLVVPLFYFERFEAQLVLAAFFLGAALMTILTARFGFSRILGAGHVAWIPLLAVLVSRLGQVPAGDFFGVWLRAVILLNLISLVIDTVDVVRYIRGDRAETVAGL